MPRPTAEQLFVSTTPGLEPALESEVRRLGLRARRVMGGVDVEGEAGLYRRLNLELRCASRVLLRVGSFAAPDARALERELGHLDLSGFVSPDLPWAVSASSHRSRVSNGLAKEVGSKVLRGTSVRDEDEGVLRVLLRLEGDWCTVSVDTSGGLLYRRGYRQEVSRAPLRETLAAGVLELAGYRGDEPLWDPMCGSGTFVLEAAWRAMRRAPGLDRTFGFESFPSHDAPAFAAQKAQLYARMLAKPAHALRASDLNAGSLGVARRNARRAGVQAHLTLERDDLLSPKALPPEPHGLLVTNPPYGKRVGEGGDIPALYAGLGRLLRERIPGWRAAILCPEEQLARAIALEPEDVFDVDNGGLALRLLLFAPSGHLR